MRVETTPTGEPEQEHAASGAQQPDSADAPAPGAHFSPQQPLRSLQSALHLLALTSLLLWRRLPAWVKRWDFALTLGLGAFVRLLWLDDTSFLGDQAELLALARSALTWRTLLATGIRSSIGALNPPASVYALLPFALSDPYVATLATALVNILAVALLYGLADRFFGRRVAFVATLLYAVSSGPVSYARFIWQQNLLAPVVILFFWALLSGVFSHRRGWLGWNVLLWGIAIQLHPTAAPLIALTLLGVYLERKHLRPRDLIFPALALLVLFLPTLLWEVATHASDAQAALGYTGRHATFDEAAELFLLALILPVSSFTVGSAAAHTLPIAWMGWLGWLMMAVFDAAQIWLAYTLVWPVYRTLRFGIPASTPPADAPVSDADVSESAKVGEVVLRWQAVYRLSLANPRWLLLALLALWQDLPLLAMLRHSSSVHPHYLLVVLPATYLILGLFLVRALDWLVGRLDAWQSAARWLTQRGLSNARRRMQVALAMVALVLAGGQGYVTLAQLQAVHTGAVETTSYGMSLGDQRLALQALDATARRYHAQAYLNTTSLLQEPLGYLAATETPQTHIYVGANCLIAPAAGAAPLVTLITSPSAAATLAPMLAGARLVRSVTLSDGASLPIYLLAPGGTPKGEQAIIDTTKPPHLNHIAPVGSSVQTSGALRNTLIIHWAGTPSPVGNIMGNPNQQPTTGANARAAYWYGASPDTQAPVVADYGFFAQPLNAAGHPLGARQVSVCGALAWGIGIAAYSVLSPPARVTVGQVAHWRVWALAAPLGVSRPTLGPLTLESGNARFVGPVAVSGVSEL